MTIDTKQLRALALAATPGPWKHHGASVSGNTSGMDHVAECRAHRDVHDAKYIAAVAPDVVLALLDELDAVQLAADCCDDACGPAFGEIATLCGCPEWEYPGQVIRDVKLVVEQRDAAITRAEALEKACRELQDDVLHRDERLALVEQNQPVQAFFTLANVMRECRDANARAERAERELDDRCAMLEMAAEALARSQRAVQEWRNWSDEVAPPFGSAGDRSDHGQRAAIDDRLRQLPAVAERINAMISGARDPWSKIADVVDAEQKLRVRATQAEQECERLKAAIEAHRSQAEAYTAERIAAYVDECNANGRIVKPHDIRSGAWRGSR